MNMDSNLDYLHNYFYKFNLSNFYFVWGWGGITNGCAHSDLFDIPEDQLAPLKCGGRDRGDSIYPSTESYSGDYLWWFKRGYPSPGSGTPCSPMVEPAGFDQAKGKVERDSFEYSVWFRAPEDKYGFATLWKIPVEWTYKYMRLCCCNEYVLF